MFYEFSDDVITIDVDDISSSFITVGFVNVCDIERLAEKFCFSQQTVKICREENKYFRSNIEMYEDYLFASLKLINADGQTVDSDAVAMYIKKNLFIVIDVYDKDFSLRDKFLKSLGRFSPSNASIEKLVYAFLESVIDGDSRFLEDTDFYINKMEKMVFKEQIDDNFNLQLLNVKQKLLLLRNYYEQLIDIAEALEENENEIFDESDLKYFSVFINKAKRLRENVDMLRDSVLHLKEAYESSIELRLNKTMKIFTLFTVVFSPLTLITGWYGMNLSSMPELNWKWSYAFVITLCTLTVAVILFVFKKKKWI